MVHNSVRGVVNITDSEFTEEVRDCNTAVVSEYRYVEDIFIMESFHELDVTVLPRLSTNRTTLEEDSVDNE